MVFLEAIPSTKRADTALDTVESVNTPLALGLVTIAVTTVLHISCMYLIVRTLGQVLNGKKPSRNPIILISTVSIMVMGLVSLHLVGALIWAYLYVAIDEFTTLAEALYFSIVTGSSLGYGDVVLSEKWKIVSSLQAIGSFLLFSLSAGGLFQLMLNTFPTPKLK